jgi:leucyl aminopeptidase
MMPQLLFVAGCPVLRARRPMRLIDARQGFATHRSTPYLLGSAAHLRRDAKECPMEIRFSNTGPDAQDALIFPVSAAGMADIAMRLPEALRSGIASAMQQARFEAVAGTVFETWAQDGITTRRILLIGTGNGDGAGLERAGGAATARLLTSGVVNAHADLVGVVGEEAARFALGASLRSWRIDTYRTKLPERQRPSLARLTIAASEDATGAWARWAAVAEGVAFTRSLVAEPANIIYPESFVERCRVLADVGVTIEVLDEAQMTALGMGAIIGVGQGSVRPPRLLAMRWTGAGATEGAPVLLIGKGVTFDTGGISIKPAAGMEDMKWDMGGAGAVAGAMLALARRKAAVDVVGICALAENMPDGNAQRPGDVVTTMSGQTVEVINTDAEGRLVLCDAMTWAQRKYQPKIMVDLATLTGAIIISLGKEHGGMFCNDHELARQLVDAGLAVGEKLWRFPLSEAYDKMIDSPIADMKNVGPRDAGSITAAQFLQRYVESGVRWAHLDIAGMVWSDKDTATWAKGATGYGVRLLEEFVVSNFEAAN